MTRGMLVLLLAGAAGLAAADDEDKPDPKAAAKARMRERVDGYLQTAQPGAFFSTEEDVKKGRLLRVFVVGTARVSTVLGAAEGVEIAQDKAADAAKAELVKFLGSKVSIRKASSEEVILTLEGQEDDKGEGTTPESGKLLEKRTKEYEETASSIVRGLKLAGKEVKDKKLTAVYRLELATIDQVKGLKDKLNSDPNADTAKGTVGKDGDKTKGPADTKKAGPKDVKDKKIIIDD